MLALSPLNKIFLALPILVLCNASSAGPYINELRSTDTTHGLYEIRDFARQFVAEQNAKNGTDWDVLDPNLKSQVTKCAVPLRAKWAPKSSGFSGNPVLVYCLKPIRGEQWTLDVPVMKSSK